MVKYPAFILVLLLFFSDCFADTFIHRDTGKSFNGYATQIKKRNKTQVRIKRKGPQYLDLSAYEIQRNHLGRKNKVYAFSIKDPISFIYEAEAFEKAVVVAANQGPLFVLIEIDASGGRMDLAQRICAAITKTDNCRTVAFVSGGKAGGAFSAAAMIALACNELYIANNTAIGAASPVLYAPSGIRGAERAHRRALRKRAAYRQAVAGRFILPDRPDIVVPAAYVAALAEQNNRPTVISKAMFDKSIEVIEVTEDEKISFVEPKNKDPNQVFVRTWSDADSLLTLTASEAERCNIADKMVPSLNQLLIVLDAVEAGVVRNTDSLKAKRRFEKVREKFNEIAPAITYLEKRSDDLLEELNQLEQRIRRGSPWYQGRRYQRYYRYGVYRYDWYIEQMLIEREALIGELLAVLRGLRLKYERAVRLAEEHLDLNADIDSLVEGMNSVVSRYNEVRNRPNM